MDGVCIYIFFELRVVPPARVFGTMMGCLLINLIAPSTLCSGGNTENGGYRFLDFSKVNEMKSIPSTIASTCSIQSLDGRYTRYRE